VAAAKPKRGMVDAALKDFDIDLKQSIIIGDREDTDGALARSLGIEYKILKR
jgi:D-alpha,beta-D-heptose 1,7-bisphosphate phosphatase (EC 3.1.3.-)